MQQLLVMHLHLAPWILPLLFLIAAIWALQGTNAQAAMARQRLLTDDDPLIAAAGRAWRPGPRLVAPPSLRRRRVQIEAMLRSDPKRWSKYQTSLRELSAWNALESSVAIAAGASVLALVAALVG
jgi:hypothetical protein